MQPSIKPPLDELVALFRQGDTEAGGALLKRFEGLLQKYYRVLTTGSYHVDDIDNATLPGHAGQIGYGVDSQCPAIPAPPYGPRRSAPGMCDGAAGNGAQLQPISGAYKFVLKDRVVKLLKQTLPELDPGWADDRRLAKCVRHY